MDKEHVRRTFNIIEMWIVQKRLQLNIRKMSLIFSTFTVYELDCLQS